MKQINLLKSAPRIKRRFDNWRTDKNRIIAKRFDEEFFDGDRANGYGGYTYDGRWKDVVNRLEAIYGINSKSSVLDVGCAKGFLLYDLQDMISGIKVAGLDILEYAINQAEKKVFPHMIKGSADELPYEDNSFDFFSTSFKFMFPP